MTDTEYNHLVDLRNQCYRDRRDRETEINYFTGFNDGYEKGKESLAEENAKLKEKLGDVQMQKAGEKSDLVWHLKEVNEQKADQLTKAKELLKEFVHHYKSKTIYVENMQDLLEQSEQFISEVEK